MTLARKVTAGGGSWSDPRPVCFGEGTNLRSSCSKVPDCKRLFTATLSIAREDGDVFVFHACHAGHGNDVLERLAERVPAVHLFSAMIREGIDVDDPLVSRLVPGATLARLAASGDCCDRWRPLQHGGSLHIVENVER